jgi:Ca2+-binding RTX toxin-like protein
MKSLKLINALAASAALLALPAAADAATITYDGSGKLTYQAAPGEANYFGVYDELGRLAISDSGTADIDFPADRCEEGYVPYVVVCDVPTSIDVSLGDDRDVANGSDEFDLPMTIDGGDGTDVLRHDTDSSQPITLRGGRGEDNLTGAQGADSLDGGEGNDTLWGRDANDQVQGGAGDDTLLGDGNNVAPAADLLDGGPGFDTIEHEWDTSETHDPLRVTLAGGADDGRPGENDDVRAVEHVATNSYGLYSGTEGADSFDVNQVTEASTVNGNGGDDRLDLSDGDDTVDGGTGADRIEGGNGHDRITGGSGPDVIHGDEPQGECSYIYCKPPYGNDTIDARDGEADQVDCGVGTDTATVDPIDVVAECETVNSGPEVAPPRNQYDLRVRFAKVGLRAALRRGVVAKVAGAGPGRLSVKARRGSKVVASGSGRAGVNGTGSVRLRFNKAGRRTLKRARRVKLAVTVVYTPATGSPVSRKSNLTLKG